MQSFFRCRRTLFSQHACAASLLQYSSCLTAGSSSSSSSTRGLTRIAVVGSGPAGFYFVDRILKLLGEDVSVDIVERLPTPFGLVRFGVAPDHPDTKNVVNKFTSVASDARVRFFGNVHVGQDVSVPDLQSMYDCTVLAHGAVSDRKLGIAGEDSAGVLSAREFVNWYNGHPDYPDAPADLSRTTDVGIVGLGNVALDCARILLKPAAALASTDIASRALEQLRSSAVERVHIIGRRGPLQAQFSGKELREVLGLDNVAVQLHPHDYTPTALDGTEPRKNQKGFAEMQKAHGKQPSSAPARELHLRFLCDPRAVAADAGGHIRHMTLERTALEPTAAGDGQRAVGTGDLSDLSMQLLLRSVGYRAEALPGVPFDAKRSVVPNALGRVLQAPGDAAVVPGLYVTGWLARGPTGIIGTNLIDAQQVAQSVAEDVAAAGSSGLGAPVGPSGDLQALLEERSVRYVPWEGWLAIDTAEVEAGARAGQPRAKFTSVEEMLQVASAQRL